MMQRIQTFLALILLSTCAFAQQPVLVLTDTDAYFMTIVDGVPVPQKFSQVIDWRTGSNGGSDVPTNPQPPEPERTQDPALSKQVIEWAATLKDPGTAQALALIYRMINDAVKDNTLNFPQGVDALRIATDSVLLGRLRTDHWQPFRDLAGAELNFRKQSNSLNFPIFLVAIAHGLEASADGSVKLTPTERMDIVNQVIIAIDKVRE